MNEKPRAFSDPYNEWSEERLVQIIETDTDRLTTDDYRVIFYRHLPAADYEEGLYYLEPCMSHIASAKLDRESAYPDSILCWIAHFQLELIEDGLMERVIAGIRRMALQIFSEFELFSLSKSECASRGMNVDYSEGPYNRKSVWDLLDDLTIWPCFDDILDEILDWLSQFQFVNRARWFVECAFHTRYWALLYDPGNTLDNYVRKEQIFHRLHSFALLHQAAGIASDASFTEGHTKYNRLVRL